MNNATDWQIASLTVHEKLKRWVLEVVYPQRFSYSPFIPISDINASTSN